MFALATAQADEDRLAKIKMEFAENLHTDGTVQALLGSGLSPIDVEQISDEFALGISSCFIDAWIEVSKENSVPMEEVLDQIEALIKVGDGHALETEMDIPPIDEEALACAYDVAAEAGINSTDTSP